MTKSFFHSTSKWQNCTPNEKQGIQILWCNFFKKKMKFWESTWHKSVQWRRKQSNIGCPIHKISSKYWVCKIYILAKILGAHLALPSLQIISWIVCIRIIEIFFTTSLNIYEIDFCIILHYYTTHQARMKILKYILRLFKIKLDFNYLLPSRQ